MWSWGEIKTPKGKGRGCAGARGHPPKHNPSSSYLFVVVVVDLIDNDKLASGRCQPLLLPVYPTLWLCLTRKSSTSISSKMTMTMLSFSTDPLDEGLTKAGATSPLLARRRAPVEVNIPRITSNVSTNSLTLRPSLLSTASATLRYHPSRAAHPCTSTTLALSRTRSIRYGTY